MGPDFLLAIIGPVVGTLFGGVVFLQRKIITSVDSRMTVMAERLNEVHDQITEIRISLPERYTTKDEFFDYIRSKELGQQEVLASIRELREEVIVLRVQNHRM